MSTQIIVKRTIKKYSFEQNQVRFGYALAKVLIAYEENGKLPYSDGYYKILTVLRKKLKIPGKSFRRIPGELRDDFPYIPSWAFRKQTKEQKIKNYEEYVLTAKFPK